MSAWSEKVKDAWWAIRRDRRFKILLAVIGGLIVLLVVLYGVLRYFGKLPSGDSTDRVGSTTIEDAVVTVPAEGERRIDGVAVPWEQSNLLPSAVMIENLVSVRPQAGLSQASLVYEALTEGGITRFLAIYASDEPIAKIGPIRSARHYFVDWAEEYRGIYSYVGGSPQALGVTNGTDYLIDLNQFYYPAYYFRDQAIAAPHNLFSSSELLAYALRDLNLTTARGDYTGYNFKDDLSKEDRPTGFDPLTIDFSSNDYAVEWHYDQDSNSYLRWNGGEEQLDENTEEQLAAKNIIIQKVETNLLEEDSGRLDMITISEGQALLFRDGTVQTGRWEKTERGSRTQFMNEAGEPWTFNRGQTWIEVVPKDTTITY